MRELLRRLHYLLHRREYERDLDEEMRHHLAMSAGDRGGSDSAKRQFGNITLLKEESRGMWIGTFWEQLAQDLRYGLRTMAANPLFTSMAVLSLALGIGANAAIFSFMDAILLRSLPVANPENLVVLQWHAKEMPKVVHGLSGSMYGSKGQGRTSPNFPYAAFQNLAGNGQSLSQLFAYSLARLNLVSGEQAEFAQVQFVSGGFYRGLGVRPAAGRLIVDDDDRAGAAPVAVLSYKFWNQRFNSDPAAIGRAILINNRPFTIIGVSAPEFFGVDPGSEPKVYLPLHSIPSVEQRPGEDVERQHFFNSTFYWVEMMGRLRPGANLMQAQAELGERFRQYVESTAANAAERAQPPVLRVLEGATGLDSLRREYSKPLWVLMGMVGLILIIACANIASLLLARAAARRKEIAVRLSLGAGRGRVIRQLLTESVLMSLAGGALGLVFSIWGIRSLTWLLANGNENFTLHATVNWTVLAFTLALAILTGILFGLTPALQSTRLDVNGALKESKTAAVPQGRMGRLGMGRLLVAGQIALSLLLVVGAGLFVRTLSNLYSVNLGFNSENVLLFSLNARQAGYRDEALAQYYEDLARRFQRLPGVRSVGLAQMSLVSYFWNSEDLIVPGAQPSSGERMETCLTRVDAGFLPTMQIPILLGRGIEERDMRAPRVAVVTEEFVKKFFPDRNPIGRRIGFGKDKPADVEIIGVARTAKYNSVKETETPPVAYVPFTQDPERLNQMFVHIRAVREPLALASAVRKMVKEASPNVPVGEMKTQTLQIDQTITEERIFARLCSAFATLALLIACVGLYGTMAYTVARRTGEIGIRMALGAEQRRVIGTVLRDVFALACAGVVIGMGAAWVSTRFLEAYLYGVKQHDPAVLAGSVMVLVAAAAVAGCVPAWRAAKIDPMVALRHE